MRLSIVVTSYNAGRLDECLEALTAQSDASEIIVSDCSAVDPSARIAARFPRVRVLHVDEVRSVPELRWSAVWQTTGDLVGALESRIVPARDWCARMIEAHTLHPEAPVVGGPVAMSKRSSPRDWGLYFCEYGAFAPPMPVGEASDLSGANLSYKRAALVEERDWLDRRRWETGLHLRWRERGRALWMSAATVSFENSMSLGTTLRQRLAYGRGYAAARFESRRTARRLFHAAGCSVLPLLLTARLARSLSGKGQLGRFCRACHWVLLFNTAWAAGEMLGYLFGESGRAENY